MCWSTRERAGYIRLPGVQLPADPARDETGAGKIAHGTAWPLRSPHDEATPERGGRVVECLFRDPLDRFRVLRPGQQQPVKTSVRKFLLTEPLGKGSGLTGRVQREAFLDHKVGDAFVDQSVHLHVGRMSHNRTRPSAVEIATSIG